MRPKTWIFIIVIILLIASASAGYFVFKFFQKNNIPSKINILPSFTIYYTDIRDYGFYPENHSIKQGEMIIWKNLGSKNHSIIFPKLNISSGIILPEENFSIEFNYSGNFSYGCGLHPKDIGNILVN